MIDCASKTIKKEGVRGLYKGMSAPIAGKSCFSNFGSHKKVALQNEFFFLHWIFHNCQVIS